MNGGAENTTARRSWMARLFNRRQAAVLADRYLDTMLADRWNTLLLLLQAPLLALMTVMVWQNVRNPTASLYFVMVLSALWLGCMDACREIVKERALFLRERMVNLEVGAYLWSKLRVLALLNAVQVVLYAAIVTSQLDLRIAMGWLLLNLMLTTLVGTALGLLISSLVSRSDHAVGIVPLVILPQILFSEVAIASDAFRGASETVYRLMPSRWAFENLREIALDSTITLEAALKLLPLAGFGLCFLTLSLLLLAMKRY